VADMTPDAAIKMLKGMPPDRQRAILAKLPEERKQGILRQLTAQPGATPNATISATKPAEGILPRMEEELSTLQEKLSRHDVNPAVHKSDTSADFMESIPRGLLSMMRGGTDLLQGNLKKGVTEGVTGAVKASEMLGLVMAPEMEELSPSAMKAAAGKLLEGVEKVAGKLPIPVNGPGRVAFSMHELNVLTKDYMPPVVRSFLLRVTNPEAGPLTFKEARQIYSSASRLSANELSRIPPKMKAQLGEFVAKLGESLEDTAARVGQSGAYRKAMTAYHRAGRYERTVDAAKKLLPPAAKAAGLGAAGAAGAAAGYKVYKATQ
jgi:hypothetical protein